MPPLVKTPLVVLEIFTTICTWSDLMWPLIFNMSMDKITLALGLALTGGK